MFVLLILFRKRFLCRSFKPIMSAARSVQFCDQSIFPANAAPPIDSSLWLERARSTVPQLTSDRHKGQAGRIGVVGGSLEYTGAPFFAAISALLVGADLVHIFCSKAAGPVIKSYSPELIVHPVLDNADALAQIQPWLERLHVLVIGPGLGRDRQILDKVAHLIRHCRELKKPLIIDADGLFLVTQNLDLIKNYQGVILTPNAAEFSRLFGDNRADIGKNIQKLGTGVTVIEKGANDRIYDSTTGEVMIECPVGGSGRRCGGQGDLMSGSIATFYTWALQSSDVKAAYVACYAGSLLTKACNQRAFLAKGRGMLASDMIQEIPGVFRDTFES